MYKKSLVLLLGMTLFCNCAFADNLFNPDTQINVNTLEQLFSSRIPVQQGIVYTKVPRGLIISVDERYLFRENSAKIRVQALRFLDLFAQILKEVPNRLVIENHTHDNDLSEVPYNTDWELSIARSGNIFHYLSKYKCVPALQMFPLGYGNFMPFNTNVSSVAPVMNRRVDFVVIQYDAKR